jgi:hypothetical protein
MPAGSLGSVLSCHFSAGAGSARWLRVSAPQNQANLGSRRGGLCQPPTANSSFSRIAFSGSICGNSGSRSGVICVAQQPNHRPAVVLGQIEGAFCRQRVTTSHPKHPFIVSALWRFDFDPTRLGSGHHQVGIMASADRTDETL